MAWRAIQDTVGVSLSLAELDDRSERIWWRILAHSDPWGRLDARPGKVRALCFPLLSHISDGDVGRALQELERVGRVVVWEHRGQQIIQIVDFEQRQPREAFRKRPPASDYPDPPANLAPTEGLIERLYPTIPDTFRKPSGNPEPTLAFAGHSGNLPEPFRTPSGGDGEETETERRDNPSSSSTQDPRQTTPDDDDDDARIRNRLRAAGWTDGRIAIVAGRGHLELASTWLDAAERDPTITNPGAYAFTMTERGQPPEKQAAPTLARGATGTRSTSPPLPNRAPEPEPERIAPPAEFLALANGHPSDTHTKKRQPEPTLDPTN